MTDPDSDTDLDLFLAFPDYDSHVPAVVERSTQPEINSVAPVQGGTLITIYLPTIEHPGDFEARNRLYEAAALALLKHDSEVWNLI